MEQSFANEVRFLASGEGQTFDGEVIAAVAKAVLQAGVGYVGGYQGSPVSHPLDVMVQAHDYLETLGVHVEACTNEAAACAMLAASINYPIRGAVTWKSIVGTNVASDALSNIASAGVQGGAPIVVGEDYGEGSSVVQERTHAFAMKSSVYLLDPRPDLPHLVRIVEHAFPLSEAASTPVILQLRIRACHLKGGFVCKDNVAPALSTRHRVAAPPPHNPSRMSHPPFTFVQERRKVEERLPAARRYIVEHGINEIFAPAAADAGVIVQGGLFNALMRALAIAGLVDERGVSGLPLLVLNATYPLVPDQLAAFCAGKRAVLLLEEGHPEFIEFELATVLGRAGSACAVRGKAMLHHAGEYGSDVIVGGLERFVAEFLPARSLSTAVAWRADVDAARTRARELLAAPVPARPPGFCTGCPVRPMFSALKLVERELGPRHVAADIGCHSFAMFEPFFTGNSITGYGMGLSSAAGVAPISAQRPLATVGDGGFWHNGFLSGVTSAGRAVTLQTSAVTGLAVLRATAALRPLRPRSRRFAREQQEIEQWLAVVARALAAGGAGAGVALELARLPRLRKGYGDIWTASHAQFERILASQQATGGSADTDDAKHLRAAMLAAIDTPACASAGPVAANPSVRNVVWVNRPDAVAQRH